MNGHANTYAAYQSKGNNVVGNTCSSVAANNQFCYVSGNSGGNQFSKVTLSPTEMK
jgi:hypothetical protein